MPPDPTEKTARLLDVARLFLRLGFTAFGGPAAHIGMMHSEVVQRRRWLSDQGFLDLVGATNLIPGPNSTEMAIHLGLFRAGWPGLVVAGSAFIIPAMLIVIAFAWVYVHYGSNPAADWLLYGIKPVVIAIIFQALYGLGRSAVKGLLTAFVGLAVFGLYFFQFNEIGLLFAGGLLVMLIENYRRLRQARLAIALPALPELLPASGHPIWRWILPASNTAALFAPVSFNLPLLFLTFLKIGSVLYGSGYVLLAFLRADFVTRFGWLTDQQLIDAVAIGQVTPGPVFTTATFIGFLLGSLPGALLATVGIFLPAFVFVAISHPWIPRLRHSPWTGALLDGVNVASLGLMAAVTVQLGEASLVDTLTWILAIASAVLLLRFKINTTWLVLGGAAAGLAIYLLRTI